MPIERMTNKSLKDFTLAVASNSFAPGGGCVSALAGSLAAALAQMVFSLTIGKKKYAEFDAENTALAGQVAEHLKVLLECVDRDADGCDRIMEAMALPKDTEVEKTRRKLAISEASKLANEAPLAVCERSLELLRLFRNSLTKVNRNTISDWAVGAFQAYTALEGAMMNAKLNCASIDDPVYCRELAERFRRMLGEGRALLDQIRADVHAMVDASN
ncbi:MAG: Formiminotetrahydrofolate cyclodeaminase [Candidatus Ozemobacter sibiricus]|uniref:Formiminotetrahydrofolate cyclodeaminase n=1 Tax=Candidatus Ozemobacter sibiricus TaxID=2268124 RepID=A0A367ZRE2_9BACT|nr:MAG: Formiminotetrahydrofolate cyclodeaminase [Candidatus Ozemobacter sibiricus]